MPFLSNSGKHSFVISAHRHHLHQLCAPLSKSPYEHSVFGLFPAQIFLVRLHGKTERAEDEEEVIYLPGADEGIRNEIYGKYEVAQSQHAQQDAQLAANAALAQHLKKILYSR